MADLFEVEVQEGFKPEVVTEATGPTSQSSMRVILIS